MTKQVTQQLKFWVVMGFKKSLHLSIPDPALFRTELEAETWCERYSTNECSYGYQLVRLGRLTP